MKRFLIQLPKLAESSMMSERDLCTPVEPAPQRRCTTVDPTSLILDPGLRKPISEYPPNERDSIRKAHLRKGPWQPVLKVFPARIICQKSRQFCSSWYKACPDWLEYSESKDAVFCLHCYLFGCGEQGGADAFVIGGYRNWKKKERLKLHVGGHNSSHIQAYRMGRRLQNDKQHIQSFFVKQSEESRIEYRIRLKASVIVVRFLLQQGLAFRGHDESVDSSNQGNFLELLKYTANCDERIKNVVLENAPANLKLIAPDIQKKIVGACAVETTNVILNELGDSYFSGLIDESRDISVQEQMAVVLRYVTKDGWLVERFLGIVHVKETSAISLKAALESIFLKHGLCIKRLCGQGYDGASNMHGQLNGLKSLIMRENESAYYIHCFAHQLQLALVAVANNVDHVATFFNTISSLVNIVGASCKRRDFLREAQAAKIQQSLITGELSSGKGLNQEITMKQWGIPVGGHIMGLY